MKTSTMIVSMLVISAIALLLITLSVQADQRMESWQNLCHFSYDPTDADNEIYFGNCRNSIDTYDAGDGAGRLASGRTTVLEERVFLSVNGQHKIEPDFFGPTIGCRVGSDVEPGEYGDDCAIINTPCVMVTSNYDAANDDNNETVYATNDWVLQTNWQGWDQVTRRTRSRHHTMTLKRRYVLRCYDGVKQ